MRDIPIVGKKNRHRIFFTKLIGKILEKRKDICYNGGMKRKNFMWKMACSIGLYVLLPIYVVLDGLIMVVSVFGDDDFGSTALWVNLAFVVMWVLSFGIFLIMGAILYKRQNFRQDENAFYQNKKKLEKKDVLHIHMGRFFSMFSLTFFPKNEGKIRSKKLLFYFYSYEEMVEFVKKNHVFPYLDEYLREALQEEQLLKGWKMTEEGLPTLESFPCPCCGQKTFSEKPNGTFFICPVCYWEDDDVSVNDPDRAFSCNGVSLNTARENYKKFGACREEEIAFVRKPNDYEKV